MFLTNLKESLSTCNLKILFGRHYNFFETSFLSVGCIFCNCQWLLFSFLSSPNTFSCNCKVDTLDFSPGCSSKLFSSMTNDWTLSHWVWFYYLHHWNSCWVALMAFLQSNSKQIPTYNWVIKEAFCSVDRHKFFLSVISSDTGAK